jgi:hypothetical protein
MADDDMYVRVTGRYALLMNGILSVEDLDDEELSRGQLKASDGSFRGRPPKMIPQELAQAMRREWLSRAEAKLREALYEGGIGTLTRLATDTTIDPGVQLRASQMLMERTMGKVPDKVQIAAEDPVEALFRNILNDPMGLVPHELSAEERAMLQ